MDSSGVSWEKVKGEAIMEIEVTEGGGGDGGDSSGGLGGGRYRKEKNRGHFLGYGLVQ